MSNPYSHLNGDHLLTDTCSWYSYTGRSEDGTTLEKTETFAAAVSTACMITSPSRRWQATWAVAQLTNTREVWLPEATAVAPKDKITHGGVNYRVLEVNNWQGFQVVLIERIEGVT